MAARKKTRVRVGSHLPRGSQLTRLAEAVRLLIAAYGMDHHQLADAIGVDRSSVSRFLAGQQRLGATPTFRLLGWLGDCESSSRK